MKNYAAKAAANPTLQNSRKVNVEPGGDKSRRQSGVKQWSQFAEPRAAMSLQWGVLVASPAARRMGSNSSKGQTARTPYRGCCHWGGIYAFEKNR